MTTRDWQPDVLDGFDQVSLTLPPAADGPVDVVLIRRRSALTTDAAVLYVHGFSDYFFQSHLADFFEEQGVRFYAVDLRRHGRALRDHQLPNYTSDVAEYLADLDAAIDVLVEEEGVEWLVVDGHSTGGLAAVLQADHGRRRADVDAVTLNSPFLDMNLPSWQESVVEPVLASVGRVLPTLTLPGLSTWYGESIHSGARGEWDFDLAWKPMAGFPVRAGWFRAIHAAQARVERGLRIDAPVLLLHSSRSSHPTEWDDDVARTDTVLDVADMVRLGPRLGAQVELAAVTDGLHDLALSAPGPRADYFRLLGEWLGRVRP